MWQRHRGLVVAGLALATASVVVIVAVAVYAYVINSRIDRVDVQLHPSRSGGTTYLILGSDSREGVSAAQRASVGRVHGARADLVLVLRVPDDGSTPRLLSVPRDLLVLGDDLGLHRLALTRLAGPQATIDALCQSLGIGEDHFVELDLAGFTKIVDAVGGVDVDLPAATRDTVLQFSFPQGSNHLDGAGALSYVRARSLEQLVGTQWLPVENQRAEQAQHVLKAVARDAELSVTDPIGTHRLLWAVSDALTVDGNMGLRDLRRLAEQLRRIDLADDVRLPALEDDRGPIPFAQIQPGAARALARVGSGGPDCRHPALPEAAG